MRVKTVLEMQKEPTYNRYHVIHGGSKAFITSTEGFWDQTEYPIIRVEKRVISSKRIPQLSTLEKRDVEIVCLVYSEIIDESVIDKTLTAEEVVRAISEFRVDNYICCYQDGPETDRWYFECINIVPSDDYDCRRDNIEKLYKDYHKTAFLA